MIKQWHLEEGHRVGVETDQFCLSLFADAVRGGALRVDIRRDPCPGSRGVPASLDGAELALVNPDRPILEQGSWLVAVGEDNKGKRVLDAGIVQAIYPLVDTEYILPADAQISAK